MGDVHVVLHSILETLCISKLCNHKNPTLLTRTHHTTHHLCSKAAGLEDAQQVVTEAGEVILVGSFLEPHSQHP